MSDFNALLNRITTHFNEKNNALSLSGLNFDQFSFIFNNFLKKNIKNKNFVFICETEEQCDHLFTIIDDTNKLLLLGNEDIYSSYVPSESDLFYRFGSYYKLLKSNSPQVVITNMEAIHFKAPPKEFFSKNAIDIVVSDIISPIDLSRKLNEIGYHSNDTIEEPGQFARRGEVFDIFTLNDCAYRIIYFDDMIEEIIKIDISTKRSINSQKFDAIQIPPTPHIFTNSEFKKNLRTNLPIPSPQFKVKFNKRRELLSKLNEGNLFDTYPNYVPLFFSSFDNFTDYIDTSNTIFISLNAEESYKNHEMLLEQLLETYNIESQDIDSELVLPDPSAFYSESFFTDILQFKQLNINEISIVSDELENIELKLVPTSVFFTTQSNLSKQSVNKYEYVKGLLNNICSTLKDSGHLYVLYRNENSRSELQYLLEENEVFNKLKKRVQFIMMNLDEGFYYKNEKLFVLTESDLFGIKRKKASSKSNQSNSTDLFAEQLSTLSKGDYVIHKEHGVGIYEGLETLDYNGIKSDYLTINYAGSDKVYVPVYRLNLIQKHADSSQKVSLASLNNNKFDKTKAKARQSVKKLAFDLLELQAKRKLKKGYQFSPVDHIFKEFELSFNFVETPDQKSAIDDIIDDMTSPRPMDRLVCGDVGFGKTEVAMRAAFKAVLDNKQVALLVPTTVLAYQHYHSFVNRMKDFPVNIEFISRFKTGKQVKQILEDLAAGKVDIIVGTHKLLSDQIKYNDLGLVIIDEEHRFGVGHKEKLKLLKENIDCLTLTATPIPRTLQLSFLGIRDLSLIKTAPPKRQSIKTYLVKNDLRTIKNAIEKELHRGGQAFIVHNRVHDIEEYAARISKQVPNAKIVIAHGQLNERELEKRIKDFYDRKYDILLATTIIESGIDIPSANTMIVDRADTYGLAQLHQLRGRIGRSNKKAYAYFIIPNDRNITGVAARRLKALQTYAEMGSGFSIASSDLEIRGSGDILGAEQSGHIQHIGLELYMELLQEAINELKGIGETQVQSNIEISTPFDAFIPNQYISNSAKRLKYYKRLSNCNSLVLLEEIKDELQDFFGIIPKSLENLFIILESRIYFGPIGVKNVKVSSKSITISFDQEKLDKNDTLKSNILNFFMQRPKIYKLSPDYSIKCLFKDVVNQQTLLDFAKNIAEQIHPC